MAKEVCLVTARSAVSAFGPGAAPLSRALREGRSGVSDIRGEHVPADFPVRHAGLIPFSLSGDHAEKYFDLEMGAKHLWVLDQLVDELAPSLAGLRKVDALIFGFGRVKGGWDAFDGSPPFPDCDSMTRHFTERLAKKGIGVPAQAGVYIVDGICTTGSIGIGVALDKMRSSRWSSAVVVMVDLATSTILWGLNSLGALSRYTGDAAQASRPFSASRSGFVRADGAAAVVLETAESADRRGAKAVASILGWGRSSDGTTLTAGREDALGVRECMDRCLKDAGLEASDVELIKAHGTGTLLNDAHEAKAIHEVFGPRGRSVPVISFKGQFGHTANACGLFELLLCETLLSDGMIYPSMNCEDLDERLGLNVLREAREFSRSGAILFNAFGFGGVNCSYVVGPRRA